MPTTFLISPPPGFLDLPTALHYRRCDNTQTYSIYYLCIYSKKYQIWFLYIQDVSFPMQQDSVHTYQCLHCCWKRFGLTYLLSNNRGGWNKRVGVQKLQNQLDFFCQFLSQNKDLWLKMIVRNIIIRSCKNIEGSVRILKVL